MKRVLIFLVISVGLISFTSGSKPKPETQEEKINETFKGLGSSLDSLKKTFDEIQ